MKRAKKVTDDYFKRGDGHTPRNFEETIRSSRRDALTDLLARCYHYPDAPAQTLIPFIHEKIWEGKL